MLDISAGDCIDWDESGHCLETVISSLWENTGTNINDAWISVQTSTVPYLIDNPEVGYVQARWVFANPDESYLTKVCTTAKEM